MRALVSPVRRALACASGVSASVVLTFVALASVVLASVLLPAAAVRAAQSPPAAAEPKPGETLCSVSDERLHEISGLVATKDGYIGVADGTSNGQVLEVFELDGDCQVTERHSFPKDPLDPEDMAVTRDGTLWIADIGDNDRNRPTVALWKIAPDRSTATIHRMRYPDGKHDAEAFMMLPDGKPVIITKDIDGNGVSGIYTPKQELRPNQQRGVPLTKVGEVTFKNTGTGGNTFGPIGQTLVTGATLSPDGTRAVVRTYSDAYEWRVSGGDVVGALTKGTPLRTPLPDEPQGEAIAFTPDGAHFVTATEGTNTQEPRLFRYEPVQPAPPPSAEDDGGGWFDFELTFRERIELLIGAVGVLGLILLLLGIWGIRKARRNPWPDEDGVGRKPVPRRRDGAGGRVRVAEQWHLDMEERRPPPSRRDPHNLYGHGAPRDPRGASGSSGRSAGRASVGTPLPSSERPSGSRSHGRATVPRDVPPRRPVRGVSSARPLGEGASRAGRGSPDLPLSDVPPRPQRARGRNDARLRRQPPGDY